MKNTSKHIPKRMIVSVAAFVILASGIIYAYTQTQKSNEAESLETTTIGTQDIILYATGLGTLANEEVSLGFHANGQVEEVLVSLGDEVEAGQVLARLESGTLKLKYEQAKANYEALWSASTIAAAKQALAEAQQSFDTARDDLQYLIGPEMLVGEEAVAEAQAALEAADDDLAKVSEAKAALAKAQETLNYAYYNYSNSYSLDTFTYPVRNTKGVTIRREYKPPTEAELLAGHAAYELAKANLSDAQNYLDVLLGRKTLEAAPASSVTAITEVRNALDAAEAGLRATELIAPISGTVTSLSLSAGGEMRGGSVITISRMDQPYIFDVSLDEADWDAAKVGYTANVSFDLLPEENYTGKVIQVYPTLDDSSDVSMIHVQVQLDHTIRVDVPAGSTASVDVTGGEALDAVVAPISALQEVEPGKYIVYLIEDGKPVEQEVEIGLQDILYAEVKSGLQVGDVVLTDATAVDQ